jgi:aspartokinase
MKIEVCKFGGSVLESSEGFELATKLVAEKYKYCKPVCVISAVRGVTDSLSSIAKKAGTGADFEKDLEDVYEKHRLIVDNVEIINSEFEKLKNAIYYVRNSSELSDSTYAYIVSRGEVFSSSIFSNYLNKLKIPNITYRGEELIVTEEDNLLDASIDLETTRIKVKEKLLPIEKNEVPIVAGFCGKSKEGKHAILGRGGSDDTAIALGYSLKDTAEELEIVLYKDEDLRNIDPKFLERVKEKHPDIVKKIGKIPEPRVIRNLSYVEASELSRCERSKILHYKGIEYLREGNLKLKIKNIRNLREEGTTIGPETDNESTVKVIGFQENLYGVYIETRQIDVARVNSKVFTALAENGVDVRYDSRSGFQISILMPKEDVERAMNVLSSLKDVIYRVTEIKEPKGTFSIVGSGMRGRKGFLAKIANILAENGINIEQAVQPNSENIISFSVDNKDIPLAVTAIYSELFKDY